MSAPLPSLEAARAAWEAADARIGTAQNHFESIAFRRRAVEAYALFLLAREDAGDGIPEQIAQGVFS